jgi:hypothetical protein
MLLSILSIIQMHGEAAAFIVPATLIATSDLLRKQ